MPDGEEIVKISWRASHALARLSRRLFKVMRAKLCVPSFHIGSFSYAACACGGVETVVKGSIANLTSRRATVDVANRKSYAHIVTSPYHHLTKNALGG